MIVHWRYVWHYSVLLQQYTIHTKLLSGIFYARSEGSLWNYLVHTLDANERKNQMSLYCKSVAQYKLELCGHTRYY